MIFDDFIDATLVLVIGSPVDGTVAVVVDVLLKLVFMLVVRNAFSVVVLVLVI